MVGNQLGGIRRIRSSRLHTPKLVVESSLVRVVYHVPVQQNAGKLGQKAFQMPKVVCLYRLDSCVKLGKPGIDLRESVINLRKPCVNLGKSVVNLRKPGINLRKALVELGLKAVETLFKRTACGLLFKAVL